MNYDMIYTNNICNICKNVIIYDEVKDGQPNCVVCPESHRCHKVCLSGAKLVKCPVCDENVKFCIRADKAFLASQSTQRIGGKRKTNKKSKRSKSKRNKSKRNKSKRNKSKRVNKYK